MVFVLVTLVLALLLAAVLGMHTENTNFISRFCPASTISAGITYRCAEYCVEQVVVRILSRTIPD